MENGDNSKENGSLVKNPAPVVAKKATSIYTGKYIIKPCKTTWLEQIDKNHDGARLFSGAEDWISPERDKNTGLIRTGLTDNEARELEIEMGLKPMDLSPYSTYWATKFKTITARVPKEGTLLDLDRSAIDKVKFAFLKIHTRVAQSYTDALENPMANWVITSAEKEAKSESTKIRLRMDAVKRLSEMGIQEQLDFLKVYEEGKYKVSKASTADFTLSTIGKIVESNPQDFLDLLNNPDFKTMSFLQDAVVSGIIKKSGPKYYIVGGDLIGNTFLDTVQNLQKPEYNEIKISLKSKLDTLK